MIVIVSKRTLFSMYRFIRLLDSVLPYIVPSWEYSVGSYNSLEVGCHFLLCKQLLIVSLITTYFIRKVGKRVI